jgi:hypothetical protein
VYCAAARASVCGLFCAAACRRTGEVCAAALGVQIKAQKFFSGAAQIKKRLSAFFSIAYLPH